MPLPPNGALSIHGYSRPGEGTYTKPKRAMLVRLNEEALEALLKLDPGEHMEFTFGDKSVRAITLLALASRSVYAHHLLFVPRRVFTSAMRSFR